MTTLEANCPWITGEINNSGLFAAGLVGAGIYGCTVEALNKNPVTDSMVSIENAFLDLVDCRASYDGGPHRNSNFRSAHTGGGHFLMADGSVQFISENIDLALYRALSSTQGGEVASIQQ